jgi:hypothetical protein
MRPSCLAATAGIVYSTSTHQFNTDVATACRKNLVREHTQGIVLGISGDNTNSSFGTFFEGAITSGWPADAIDSAILKNVQEAG